MLTETLIEVLRAANKLSGDTDMRRPLYERYGFVNRNHEMELPE